MGLCHMGRRGVKGRGKVAEGRGGVGDYLGDSSGIKSVEDFLFLSVYREGDYSTTFVLLFTNRGP